MTRSTAAIPAGLEDNLGWLLAQLARMHQAALDREVAAVPHGMRGFQALCAAVGGSARNQTELGRHLDLDRTVVVYLVADLVAAGLVERDEDPVDRRNKLIRATDKGRALLERTKAAITAAETEVLGPLDPAEQAALRDMLRAVIGNQLAIYPPRSSSR